jgi:hypothetical protein
MQEVATETAENISELALISVSNLSAFGSRFQNTKKKKKVILDSTFQKYTSSN